MSNLFQIAVGTDACGGLLAIVKIIRKGIMPIVQIFIPILLIVFGTVDLGKAVISSDEKEVKQAQSRLIKRCIYAVAIFLVVTLVTVIMNIVAVGVSDGTGSWSECWSAAA